MLLKKFFMSALISNTRLNFSRLKHRIKRKGIPVVHYFHQVDDPYSHLAVQKISMLKENYDISFKFHLCGPPSKDEQGDSSRFHSWALADARNISEHYRTKLPRGINKISGNQKIVAEEELSRELDGHHFTETAIDLGKKLWSGQTLPLTGSKTIEPTRGSNLRKKLGHWLSATFYYEGEWYWGVDRLLHLESRLVEAGLGSANAPPCVPRPHESSGEPFEEKDLTLEFFPSLRSPYSAICFDRVVALANETGVKLKTLPVMPMMMRGVKASRSKQFYILTDAKREAVYYGQAFGPIVDPIGEPVIEAFKLLPAMIKMDKETEYCDNYLKAAWSEGIDITRPEGLKKVVERTGVSWNNVTEKKEASGWEAILDKNLSRMLEFGFWGVPSFNLTGGDAEDFSCWGQDRLWLLRHEIEKRTIKKKPNERAWK